VRRIRRLQRDFEANLQSVAVMLDLIDEIERLQARLHRAGLDPLHEP
jgi:MerR HTH family regulatory protein